MKKNLLLCLILAAVVSGCKKYEEGPLISFRSAKSRVYGFYTLQTLTVDGVDEYEQYFDSLCNTFYFHYEEVSAYVDICDMSGFRKNGWGSTLVWSWKLTDHNKILEITSSSSNATSFGPFKPGYCPKWELLRLTNKEIKMKTTYNNKEYVADMTGYDIK